MIPTGRLFHVAIVLSVTSLANSLHASSIYWNGSGTGWDNTLDWSTASGATTPNPLAVPGALDTAIFNISTVTTAQAVNLNANQSVLGLQVASTSTGAITINSGTGTNTLTIGTGGITVAAGGVTPVLNAGIILNGNQTWSSAGTFVLNSLLSGAGNLTVNGLFNSNNGSANLTGSVTLTGQSDVSGNFLNGVSGGVIISNGTVGVGGGAIVSSKPLTFTSNTNWYTNGNNQTYTGSVQGGAMNNNGAGNLTLGGITDNTGLAVATPNGTTFLAKTSGPSVHAIGAGLTLATGSTTQITGTGGDQIKDSATVTLGTGATFDLNGNNETVSLVSGAGVVTNTLASSTSTISVGALGGAGTYAGVFQNGAGTLSLLKTGTGTITLTGASTYTGNTAVNGGTLVLDYTGTPTPAAVISSSSPLALGGGILSVKGLATGTTSQSFAGSSLTAGSSSGVTVNANAGSGTVVNLGAITHNSGAAINVTLPSGTQSATNGVTTTTANTGSTILGGWATANGTDWAVSGGNGTTSGNLTALSSYTNDAWAVGNNTTATTNSAPVSGSTTNSLRFAQGAQTVTLSGVNVISTGGVLVSTAVGNNLSTITGGSLTSGNGEGLYLNQNNTTNALTVASAITDNGATSIGLTKAGAGTVNVTGANTFTGPLNVGGGTLNLSGTNATASALAVTGGTLNLSGATAFTSAAPVSVSNGGILNVAANSALGSGSNAVTLSSGSTLTFANTGGALVLPTATTAYQSSSNWRNTPNFLGNVTGDNSYQVGANGGGSAQPDFILIDLGSNVSLGQFQATVSNSYRNLQFYTANSSVGSFSSLFTANGNSSASPSTLNLGLFTADSIDFNTGTTNAPTGATSLGLSGVTGEYLAIYITNRAGGTGYGLDLKNLILTAIASPITQSIGSLAGTDATSSVSLATNLTLSVGSNNTSTSFAGTVTGAGGLTKTGTGTLTVTNANTYSGGTTITGGVLKLSNASGSGTGTGSVLVNGGSLAGGGILSGPITLTSGSIAPNGTLTGAGLTWNSGGTMSFDLNNASKLSLSGILTKGSGSTFAFNFNGTGAAGTYTLANFASTTFSQSDFSYSGLAGGYTGTFALTGTTLSFITTAAVPEPSAYGAAMAGLLIFCAVARRRKRA